MRKASISILLIVVIVFLYPQMSFSGNEHKPNSGIFHIVGPSVVEISKKLAQLEEIQKSLDQIVKNRDDFENTFENNPSGFFSMWSNQIGVRNLYAHVCTLFLVATGLPETTDYDNFSELNMIIYQLKLDNHYFDYVIRVLREAYGYINNKAVLHLLDKLKDNYISTRHTIRECVEQLEALKQARK